MKLWKKVLAAVTAGMLCLGCAGVSGLQGVLGSVSAVPLKLRRGESAVIKIPRSVCENRYRNYNGGKAAFPASAAAKSAQSVQKRGENA